MNWNQPRILWPAGVLAGLGALAMGALLAHSISARFQVQTVAPPVNAQAGAAGDQTPKELPFHGEIINRVSNSDDENEIIPATREAEDYVKSIDAMEKTMDAGFPKSKKAKTTENLMRFVIDDHKNKVHTFKDFAESTENDEGTYYVVLREGTPPLVREILVSPISASGDWNLTYTYLFDEKGALTLAERFYGTFQTAPNRKELCRSYYRNGKLVGQKYKIMDLNEKQIKIDKKTMDQEKYSFGTDVEACTRALDIESVMGGLPPTGGMKNAATVPETSGNGNKHGVSREEAANLLKQDPKALQATRIYNIAWEKAFPINDDGYKAMGFGSALDEFIGRGCTGFPECLQNQLRSADNLFGANTTAFKEAIEKIYNVREQ